MNLPVENILVVGATSKKLRAVAENLLMVRPEGRVMSTFALTGAAAGIVIAFCADIVSPSWGILRSLGLVTSLGAGAVLGCMLATLIGAIVGSFLSEVPGNVRNEKLADGTVIISVKVPVGSSETQAINTRMQDCGALSVTVDGPLSAVT
jgi:hypothetical protein